MADGEGQGAIRREVVHAVRRGQIAGEVIHRNLVGRGLREAHDELKGAHSEIALGAGGRRAERDGRRLEDGHGLVRGDVRKFRDEAGGPLHADEFHAGGVAETEMRVERARAAEAVAGGDLAHLPAGHAVDGGAHADLRADPGAVGDVAAEQDAQPAIGVATVVVEEILTGDVRDEEVQRAVPVVIDKGAGVGIAAIVRGAAGLDGSERAVAVVVVKVVVEPAVVRDEDILPAVVIIVAPSAGGAVAVLGAVVDQRAGGDLREGAVAIVAIEGAVLQAEVGHEEVEVAVIVVIHPRAGEAGSSGTDHRAAGNLGEIAQRVVEVKNLVARSIKESAKVGGKIEHHEIGPAVVVVIAPGLAVGALEEVVLKTGNCAGSCENAGEGSVAIVAVKQARRVGGAHRGEEIQVTVPVIVRPRAGGSVDRLAGERPAVGAGKGAVAIVAIEEIRSVVQHHEIQPAVVVIVGERTGAAVPVISRDRAGGHACEGAVAVVAEEPVEVRPALGHEHVRVAVIIVITPDRAQHAARLQHQRAVHHLGEESVNRDVHHRAGG